MSGKRTGLEIEVAKEQLQCLDGALKMIYLRGDTPTVLHAFDVDGSSSCWEPTYKSAKKKSVGEHDPPQLPTTPKTQTTTTNHLGDPSFR